MLASFLSSIHVLDRKTVPYLHPITLPVYPTPSRWQLPNGRVCLALCSHETPLLNISLSCSLSHLDGGCLGIVKLISCLLDKGTSTCSAKKVAEQFAQKGVKLEVGATKDHLFVELIGLASGVHELIPLLADVITAPSFPEKELRIAKKKLQQQLRYERLKVTHFTHAHFFKACFGQNHFYGHMLQSKEVTPITREALENIYQKKLVGGWNIYLAGHINALTKNLITTYLGRAVGEKYKKSKQHIPPYKALAIRKKRKKNLQANIVLGFPTITLSHQDYSSLKIVTKLLGGYFGSRLMQNLREQKGYTYGITSRILPFLQKGVWLVSAEIDRKKVRVALQEVKKELFLLADQGAAREELDLLRRYLVGHYLTQLETVFDLQAALIQLNQHGLDFTFYEKLAATLIKFTTKDVQHIAQKYLQWQNLTRVVTT